MSERAKETRSADRISRPWGDIGKIAYHDKIYLKGYVITFHGIVNVYSQTDPDYTRLSFAHGGFMHAKTMHKSHSARYLVTLADRFAAEVAKEAEGGK